MSTLVLEPHSGTRGLADTLAYAATIFTVTPPGHSTGRSSAAYVLPVNVCLPGANIGYTKRNSSKILLHNQVGLE